MIAAARQTTPDADLVASIDREFPLPSQTDQGDRLALLRVRDIFRSWPAYNYLEIGSYLGGSLLPFCRDPHCRHILSIDDRGRNQPDERGATYDYTAVTSRMMLDNLTAHGVPEGRVQTYDGSVSGTIDTATRYDLVMIDGEHTTWACFRDFIHARKLMAENAVVMFHDSQLIFNSLKIIREYLQASDMQFTFFKDRRSNISFILLNDHSRTGMEKLFDVEPDMEEFERTAERRLAFNFVMNRTSLPRRVAKMVLRSQPKSYK